MSTGTGEGAPGASGALRGSIVAAVGLAILAGFALWGAFSIPSGQGFAVVDASDFPRVLSIALAVLAFSDNLLRSRVGRALRAIRGSETAAMVTGIGDGTVPDEFEADDIVCIDLD